MPKVERKAEPPKKKVKKEDPAASAVATSSEKPADAAKEEGGAASKKKEKGKKEAAAGGEAPKGKKEKAGAAPAPAAAEPSEPMPSMIDLRVGHIVEGTLGTLGQLCHRPILLFRYPVAKHPDADGLYVEVRSYFPLEFVSSEDPTDASIAT